MVAKYGSSSWSKIASNIPNRSSKQCRERWKNQIDPTIKREPWSKEEDQILTDLFQKLGPKWSQMRNQLPGRPDNQIKNRWNSTLKRMIEEKNNSQKPKKKRGRPHGSKNKNKNKTQNKKGKLITKTLIFKSYGKVIYKCASVSKMKITKQIQNNKNEKVKEQKTTNNKQNSQENEKKLETINNMQKYQKEKKQEIENEKEKKKYEEKNPRPNLFTKTKTKQIVNKKKTNNQLTKIETNQEDTAILEINPQKLRRSKRIRNKTLEFEQYDPNKRTLLPNKSTKLNPRKQQKPKQSLPKNSHTQQKINGIDCCLQKNIISDLQYCISNSNRTPTNTPSKFTKFILSLKDNDNQKQTEHTITAHNPVITGTEKRKRRHIEETEDDNGLDEFGNQNSIDHFSTPQKIRRVQDRTIYRKPNLNFPDISQCDATRNKIKHTPIKGYGYSNLFSHCDSKQYYKQRNVDDKNQKIYLIINEIKKEINNESHQNSKNENNCYPIQDNNIRRYIHDTNDRHSKKNKKLDDNFFHFISYQANLNFAKNNYNVSKN
ncbi:hypothetical protein M0813_11449 [Anaeramoeba flamelloides]|uniref:Myb-like DNA-binding domain protein n=1 Tax=Anaeramoeba flamelloides TaxID=1746091 RepID=A0ABQ8ZEM4_9EUKA|nr:hypothetical protein M0813_11449 [Anaeramoeba flamelloides]